MWVGFIYVDLGVGFGVEDDVGVVVVKEGGVVEFEDGGVFGGVDLSFNIELFDGVFYFVEGEFRVEEVEKVFGEVGGDEWFKVDEV